MLRLVALKLTAQSCSLCVLNWLRAVLAYMAMVTVAAAGCNGVHRVQAGIAGVDAVCIGGLPLSSLAFRPGPIARARVVIADLPFCVGCARAARCGAFTMRRPVRVRGRPGRVRGRPALTACPSTGSMAEHAIIVWTLVRPLYYRLTRVHCARSRRPVRDRA